MKKLLCMLSLLPLVALGQTVGIGTNAPNSSAMLDVVSTSKGLLIPRMTDVQRGNIVNPATGLMVYQTNGTVGIYFNRGTPGNPFWLLLGNAADSWGLYGNAGNNPAINFLGTTDGQAIRFRVANTWAGSIDSSKGTSIGYLAGQNDVAGNTAFGNRALKTNTNAIALTAVGHQALESNTTGSGNTAIGFSTLRANTTGTWNTAVGLGALDANIVGEQNTAIGNSSMFKSTGSANVGVGLYTLAFNASTQNTAVGNLALTNNIAGSNNVGVGYQSLSQNVTGEQSTAIGSFSLRNNKASFNTAVGAQASEFNTTGFSNTAVGYFSLRNNFEGSQNTAIGLNALSSNNADANTAVGYNAMRFNTAGKFNTAIGHSALENAPTASYNTAIGYRSQRENNNGQNNTSLGYAALQKNMIGNNNTAVGVSALYNASGTYNTAIGQGALETLGAGTGNTALGTSAYALEASGDYNTAIGYNTNSGLLGPINTTVIGALAQVNCSNCMVLGSVAGTNGATETVNVGIGTNNPVYRLQVGKPGDGSEARANAWNAFSDERYKTNIEEIHDALGKIENLHGYYYNWKAGDDKSRQAGVLAQEVEQVLPEIVSTDVEGYKSVEYGKMNALLLQAIKEQNVLMQAMQARIQTLEEKLPAVKRNGK